METIQPIPQSPQPVQSNTKNPYKILFFLSLGLFLIVSSVLITLLITQKSPKPTPSTKTEETKLTPTQPTTAPETTNEQIVSTNSESEVSSGWKTYINSKYNYSVEYLDKWKFREYPDVKSGAGFNLISVENDPSSEFISIDLRVRPSNMVNVKFEDYVKKAIIYETEGVYGDINSIEKIVTDSNIAGYKVTWDYTDRNGKKSVTLPITYFDTKDNQNDTIQISLLKAEYLNDYLKMIKTFRFD